VQANYEETLKGHVVLSVGFAPEVGRDEHGEHVGITPAQKIELDQLHMDKIEIADEVLVLNVDGYVGESTTREIAYAYLRRKQVRWLDEGAAEKWLQSGVGTREVVSAMYEEFKRQRARPKSAPG
jgi:hypothetical protein